MKIKILILLALFCTIIGGFVASAQQTEWILYEDFSDWSSRCGEWTNGTDSNKVKLVGEDNPYLQILEGSSLTRIISNAPPTAAEKLADAKSDYKILIKAQVMADHINPSRGSTPIEISLLSGTSSKKKLFTIDGLANGSVTMKVHDEETIGAVETGEWVSIIIVGEISNGTGDWTYYINNVRYDGFQYLPAKDLVNAIHFGARTNASGCVDDICIYIADETPSGAQLVREQIAPGEAAEVKLASETLLPFLLDGSVSVDGTAVSPESITLGADAQTVTILPSEDWIPQSEHSITFQGTRDVFGSELTDCTLHFRIGEEEKPPMPIRPALSGTVIPWIAYENFENWEKSAGDWTNGTDVSKVRPEAGYIRILPAASSGGMTRISRTMPAKILELLEGAENYKLVIKAKVMAHSYDASGGSTPIEISLAQSTSTKQRLFNIAATSAGKFTVQAFNQSAVAVETEQGKWLELTIIADITEKTGMWTYYIDGSEVDSYSYLPAGVDTIQFAVRGFAAGCFDDVEVYAVSGGDVPFSAVSLPTEIDAGDSLMVDFNIDLRKNGIPEGAVTVNGESVPADRISISEDGKGIIISPKSGIWIPNEKYRVGLSGLISNIFGIMLYDDTEFEIAVKGESVQAFDLTISDSGNTVDALCTAVDVSEGEAVGVYTILMLCKGNAEESMVTDAVIGRHLLVKEMSNLLSVSIAKADVDFAKLMVVRADTFAPIARAEILLDMRGNSLEK